MRHGKKFNHLSRKAPHRKALLSNLTAQLIQHKRIKTTLAKAKALRTYAEPIITRAKTDTTHSRRQVFRKLQNKQAIQELYSVVGPKVGDRPGGYTRVIRAGFRPGDNAEMAYIELVDFNEVYTTEKPKSARTRRSGSGSKTRRSSSKKKSEEAQSAVDAAVGGAATSAAGSEQE